MVRLIWLTIGAAVLVLGPTLLPSSTLLAPSQAWGQPTIVAHTVQATGTLIITRAGGGEEKLTGKGVIPLYDGDRLKTAPGSKALVQFTDGSKVALNEGSTLTISSKVFEKGMRRLVKITVGEMWVKIGSKGDELEVETPVARAAVKGTEFNLKVMEDGRSILTVVEGEVVFRTPFCSPCSIRPQTVSFTEPGKNCTEAEPTDASKATAWTREVVS